VAWQHTDVVITGHAIPGGVVGKRAVGGRNFVTTIHGSDVEYAIRLQPRYRRLAAEGLLEAAAVTGSSRDVIMRCAQLVPGVEQLAHVIPPGVDAARFRPRPRDEALLDLAGRLDADPETRRGRPSSLDEDVRRACEARDGEALDALAHAYDQTVPDPAAGARLRSLSTGHPIVGYLGKLIPQKGVELMLQAHRTAHHEAHALVVGFGSYREWLAALAIALERGDAEALAWLREVREIPIEAVPEPGARTGERNVTFTGRLDHRYAPDALAAMDVLVVPSILPEAFGMVAAEGAAAGALPLVARHSGLGEVGAALEAAIGRPGLLTFEPGPGAVARLASALDRVLELPAAERDELRAAVSAFVGREWTWDRTASGLLAAAGLDSPDRRADADPT
jgi:glycosyltransferase involved in cell wall biosynthesis